MAQHAEPDTGPEPKPSRPDIEGYGIHTSSTGMLPWSHVTDQMERSRNYWLGTTRPDGRPHAAPVWGVWLDRALYFGTGPQSRKARNLAANPALVVHLESGDDAVILEGRAEAITRPDPALFARIADVYAVKYDGFRPEYPEREGDMYVLRPRVAFAWLERDFPATATRWLLADG